MQTGALLGRSPIRVQRVAFGCEQLGGYGWGSVDPTEVSAAIAAAVDSGPILFDTADCYGKGISEQRLGDALRGENPNAFVATKFGVRFSANGTVYYDNSREWAEVALSGSLRRLQRDRIDLYQLHYHDGRTPLESIFEWLERQRTLGRIGWYGVSNLALDASMASGYPGLVTQSLELSLANRAAESVAQAAMDNGLTFIAYGVLAQGMLSGRYNQGTALPEGDRRRDQRYVNFHGEKLRDNLALVEVLCRHAADLGVAPAQLAIAWILNHLPRAIALVGIKRPQQFADAHAALLLSIPEDVQAELDSVSLAAAT